MIKNYAFVAMDTISQKQYIFFEWQMTMECHLTNINLYESGTK